MAQVVVQIPRVRFGAGALAGLPDELRALGVERPFLMTDAGLRRIGVIDRVKAVLGATDAISIYDEVAENPTVDGVDHAAIVYRRDGCDGVIALGGGSVIDSAKGVALLGAYGGSMMDHLGRSEGVTRPVAPLISIPTTSGSGSEASPAIGLHPDAHAPAIGTRSPFLVSNVAILDPELTRSLPARLTAATGMDALAHCLEGWLSLTEAPIVDALCISGAKRVFKFLRTAVDTPDDLGARGEMMLASLEGGIGIVKGLGPAHALANTFSIQGLHHGALVALSLGPALELGETLHPERLAQLSVAIFGAEGIRLSAKVRELMASIGLATTLPALGFKATELDPMVRDAVGSHFNRPSPYKPTPEHYRALIVACLGE
jgi:4-hydroxybutyrate dehydrogenase